MKILGEINVVKLRLSSLMTEAEEKKNMTQIALAYSPGVLVTLTLAC